MVLARNIGRYKFAIDEKLLNIKIGQGPDLSLFNIFIP
tara:strand:+ start:10233 stop:10346 length:114 start_codon:yes stop_codon:yes gene_type:complete